VNATAARQPLTLNKKVHPHSKLLRLGLALSETSSQGDQTSDADDTVGHSLGSLQVVGNDVVPHLRRSGNIVRSQSAPEKRDRKHRQRQHVMHRQRYNVRYGAHQS